MMISERVTQPEIDLVVALKPSAMLFFPTQRTQISNQIYLGSEVQLYHYHHAKAGTPNYVQAKTSGSQAKE